MHHMYLANFRTRAINSSFLISAIASIICATCSTNTFAYTVYDISTVN